MKYLIDHFIADPNDSMAALRIAVAQRLNLPSASVRIEIIRRHLEYIEGKMKISYDISADTAEFIRDTTIRFLPDKEVMAIKEYTRKDSPVIVGAGLTGLYLAYRLAQSGANPIVLEMHEETLNSNNTLQIEDNFHSYGGFHGRNGALFIHDGSLISEEIFQLLTCLNRINPSNKDVYHFLTPEDCVAITTCLVSEIRKMGGQVLFGCKWIGADFFLKKLKKVHFIRAGKEEVLPAKNLIFTTGSWKQDTLACLGQLGVKKTRAGLKLGVAIEYPYNVYKSTMLKGARPNWPTFFINEGIKSKSGRKIFFHGPYPKGFLHSHGVSARNEVRLALDGKDDTAIFILSVDLHPDELDFLYEYDGAPVLFQELYRKDKPICIPVEATGDFMRKAEPWKLAKAKRNCTAGIFLENLHSFLPDFISDAFQYGLVHLARKYPLFLENSGLVYGFLESRGTCFDVDNEEYYTDRKGIYYIPQRQSLSLSINKTIEDGEKAFNALMTYF